MKNIILILLLITAMPLRGMQKKQIQEPLDNQERNQKSPAKIYTIINNTNKPHIVCTRNRIYRVPKKSYKNINTHSKSLVIDGEHQYMLDPNKIYFYLGAPLEDHAAL